MRIRNNLPIGDPFSESKTKRQWMELGFIPKFGALGERMWSNAFCQHEADYFRPGDVRSATDEEKEHWAAEQREQNRVRAAKSRERKRKEKEQLEMKASFYLKWNGQDGEQEQQRQAAAMPFYDETIARGRKFAPVLIEDYGCFTYIMGRDVPVGTSVTVPFSEDNTPMSGIVEEGEYSFEDLKDAPWFPFAVKAILES